jgi:hypothetical protein
LAGGCGTASSARSASAFAIPSPPSSTICAGALPDHTDAGSPRLANLCDGRPDARDDVIDHLTGADLDHRLAERLGQLPYDLGVVIDRIENAINGPGDVV